MKIRDIIRILLSGEDFTDHSTGKEDGNAPRHDVPGFCDFCEAWRQALWLIGPDCPKLIDFEAGDKVRITGGGKGRVIATDITVRVEVQNEAHGPFAVGSFRPQDLAPWVEPEFYADRDGDIWQVVGDGKLSLCKFGTWEPHTGKAARVVALDEVRDHYGPLVSTVKP